MPAAPCALVRPRSSDNTLLLRGLQPIAHSFVLCARLCPYAMPRGGARPKSPGFSKAIAASNKMRGFANRKQKMLAAQRLSHQKVFGGSVPMRVDEASFFAGGGSGLDLEPRLRQGSCRIRCRSARPKQPNGVRTDQQFTAQAICIAGMTHKETDAKTKNGYVASLRRPLSVHCRRCFGFGAICFR